ncbi:MAG TPA: hypothetical protein VGE66_01415 [Chitinophagaceae bacterium]
MARIFTTSFKFRHQTYTALVSVQKKEDNLCIQIRLQDEDLQGLLPDGMVRLCERSGQSTSLDGQPALVQELVHTVSDAVERYLTSHRVAGAA